MLGESSAERTATEGSQLGSLLHEEQFGGRGCQQSATGCAAWVEGT